MSILRGIRNRVEEVVTVLGEAVASNEFQLGFRTGLAALVMAALGAGIWRWRTGRPAGVAGVFFSTAALMALSTFQSVPSEMVLGVGLLGLASLATLLVRSLTLQVAMAVPGAWLVAGAIPEVYSSWTGWFLMGAIAVGGPLVAHSDRVLSRPVLGPVLFAVTVGGVYVNVPDTETMLVVLGVVVPLAVLGWPLGVSRLGSAGSHMAVGSLLWASSWGGVGRTASMVGVAACLGVFLTIPLAVEHRLRVARLPWPALVGIHLFVVAVAGRIAGHREHPLEALLIAAAALAVGLALTERVLGDKPVDINEDQGTFESDRASLEMRSVDRSIDC